MAQCKLCDCSGWFLSLSDHALCQRCEGLFQLDLHQRVRIIKDSQKIIETSRNLATKLSRIEVAISHLKALLDYERRGINTILPPPSEAIRNYESRREEDLAHHAALVHDEAVAKAKVGGNSRSTITALSKGLLKLRALARYNPSNFTTLEQGLLDRIARETMSDYLDKARKAEFKGQKKKALEQYYEALYFLKHDKIDDRLQADHIKPLEEKIIALGGTLNYEGEKKTGQATFS